MYKELKQRLNLDINDAVLKRLLFDKSRYFDNVFVERLKEVQKRENVVYNRAERDIMRVGFYYGDRFAYNYPSDITTLKYTNDDIEKVSRDFLDRLDKYDDEKIISSIQQRFNELNEGIKDGDNAQRWLAEYDKRRENKLFSLCVKVLDQEKFEQSNFDENCLIEFIKKTYKSLENYRYMAIVIRDELYSESGECITWKMIYKAGVYAENFIQFKGDFHAFNQTKKEKELSNFLKSRNVDYNEKLAEDFYRYISTGFMFEDCYVSDNQDCKIVIFKKVELDESHFSCPSCCTVMQRGNSYPQMFLRSYECTNPNCPDRSKSGRGKRFDEYGVYRYFKLIEGNSRNNISDDVYRRWRRDIFNHDNNYLELLLKEYSYSGETVFVDGVDFNRKYFRNNVQVDIDKLPLIENSVNDYEQLPIVRLFREINKRVHLNEGSRNIENNIEEKLCIVNEDSSKYLQKIKPNQIGAAITSPPYYNAREYSQWPNMLLYFIDMFINCKVVYKSISRNGHYLYNIGDIVAEDNVYVNSNMSKRRVPLGFLSCMIFEIAGFNLCGNIIWDKGEVQSKRNSTVNLFSGYVKCINCYEHVWVFKKGKNKELVNDVVQISPVIKINSKGANTYGHTAPYPQELVECINPYVMNNKYVLDPFLGSGTTLRWCAEHNISGIGIEMNDEYYQLALNKMKNVTNK